MITYVPSSMVSHLIKCITVGFIFAFVFNYSKALITDPCADLPCSIYGTCNITIQGLCRCIQAGHQLPNCTDIDECISGHRDVCLHRGFCNNTDGGFICTCLAGWEGKHCQDRNKSVNETCMPGYFGDGCKNTSCDHGYPEHNPDFHITNNTIRCVCDEGWNKSRPDSPCDMDIDECLETNPCLNSGTCSNTNGNYHCSCVFPWSGKNCSETKTEETTTFLSRTSTSQETVNVGPMNALRSSGPGTGLAAGLSVGGIVVIAVVIVFLVLKFKYKHSSSDILSCKLKRSVKVSASLESFGENTHEIGHTQ
ncbi:neurogenic locus notch homolog protein 2-like isoform X2 [Dreissena polymorpha]|uniref:neurogenic locus notch homolog protein 2-like isoform X2 n=1 Tax=Dreissena polymorpha TaxID=45954 RepID=UPI002263CFEC|nr:neurogenic locus notch homolog protein 2-like isoform X2 [Dreissena polymorpha]